MAAVITGVTSILGLEIAGIVEDVGRDARLFKKGDKVLALLDGGGCVSISSQLEKMVFCKIFEVKTCSHTMDECCVS